MLWLSSSLWSWKNTYLDKVVCYICGRGRTLPCKSCHHKMAEGCHKLLTHSLFLLHKLQNTQLTSILPIHRQLKHTHAIKGKPAGLHGHPTWTALGIANPNFYQICFSTCSRDTSPVARLYTTTAGCRTFTIRAPITVYSCRCQYKKKRIWQYSAITIAGLVCRGT